MWRVVATQHEILLKNIEEEWKQRNGMHCGRWSHLISPTRWEVSTIVNLTFKVTFLISSSLTNLLLNSCLLFPAAPPSLPPVPFCLSHPPFHSLPFYILCRQVRRCWGGWNVHVFLFSATCESAIRSFSPRPVVPSGPFQLLLSAARVILVQPL